MACMQLSLSLYGQCNYFSSVGSGKSHRNVKLVRIIVIILMVKCRMFCVDAITQIFQKQNYSSLILNTFGK